MKKVLSLFFFLFFFFTPAVFAQDSGWVIEHFDADIHIEKTGIVRIAETLQVDFRNYEKHGIYRDIPYVYDNKNGEKYYTEIEVKSVSQDKGQATYKVYNNGSYVRIQIGDADKTISGKHVYVIEYTAKGILQKFSTYDEIYWNVTGDQWPVFIDTASAIVTLPEDVPLGEQLSCYQGPVGSTQPCNVRKDKHSALFVTNGLLGSREGMTIALSYAPNKIPVLHVDRPKTFLEKFFSWPSLMTLLSVAAFGFLTSFLLWYKNGRDFWHGGTYHIDGSSHLSVKPVGQQETIVAEFTPPDNLRPAEIGVLIDETADTLDVTGTIIDLTSRGYMTITEIPKKWLFGSTDYELKKSNKSYDGLVSYEKYILDEIFESGDVKKVSSLKNEFYDELAKVKDMLYKDMVDKQLFVENPNSRRNLYGGIGIVLLIVGVWASFISAGNECVYVADVTIGLAVSGLILLIFSRYMGRRSAKGRELYRRVRGYREFVYTAERYKQKFLEKENLFAQVLPYAIVFGLTEKFAQAMKEIGLKNPHVSGYYGSHPFNAYTFTNSVNAFSNSFSSAAASKPSSSGSGGGGSSGGGFGGGGGGSW